MQSVLELLDHEAAELDLVVNDPLEVSHLGVAEGCVLLAVFPHSVHPSQRLRPGTRKTVLICHNNINAKESQAGFHYFKQ